MPNYDYYCPKCGEEAHDIAASVDDRHTAAPRCACKAQMLIKITGCLEAHPYRKHGFPEHDRGMGRTFKTWEEKRSAVMVAKAKMDKMGYEMEVNL